MVKLQRGYGWLLWFVGLSLAKGAWAMDDCAVTSCTYTVTSVPYTWSPSHGQKICVASDAKLLTDNSTAITIDNGGGECRVVFEYYG